MIPARTSNTNVKSLRLAGRGVSLAFSKFKIGFFTIVMAFTNAANKKITVKKINVNSTAEEFTAVK